MLFVCNFCQVIVRQIKNHFRHSQYLSKAGFINKAEEKNAISDEFLSSRTHSDIPLQKNKVIKYGDVFQRNISQILQRFVGFKKKVQFDIELPITFSQNGTNLGQFKHSLM